MVILMENEKTELTQWQILVFIALLGFTAYSMATEPQQLKLEPRNITTFEFDDSLPIGLERKRFADSIRVRGWQVGSNVYFGQTKVGKKWGLGVAVERGDTVYGLNHRGIQVLKRF